MKAIQQIIDSGWIESYLLGSMTDGERVEFEMQLAESEELQQALEDGANLLEELAFRNAITPDPTIKPFLRAKIDYMERLESGEPMTFPPTLTENARISDYEAWLNREDMHLSIELEDVFAKIIGFTPEQTTAIVWIKEMAPDETHSDEFERFLIVEGTCDIQIGEEIHSLVPGDYLQIPLHVNHFVTVTSEIPCKVILQRVAA